LVPVKKKFDFGPCKILFFKIVSDPIFVMTCIRGTWWLDPFCSFWSLQNILFFKWVPAKKFVSENSPWRDYFKKQKFLQRPKSNFFFYRDQNLNEAYLQGRLPYLSLVKIMIPESFGAMPEHWLSEMKGHRPNNNNARICKIKMNFASILIKMNFAKSNL